MIYATEFDPSTISELDIDKMKIGDFIQCHPVPVFIRKYCYEQKNKKFFIHKIGLEEYAIFRSENIRPGIKHFKNMKTGEYIDIIENRTKCAQYAHTYGNSSKKKFKTETFNDPDQGKFLRVTRIS